MCYQSVMCCKLHVRWSFHKKLQNEIILLILKNMKNWKYMFCREFTWEHILEFL